MDLCHSLTVVLLLPSTSQEECQKVNEKADNCPPPVTPAPTPILLPVVIPLAEDAFSALDVGTVIGDSIKILNAETDHNV